MKRRKKHPVLYIIKFCFRIFYPRYEIKGIENMVDGQPSIFVCNHDNLNGPISMELFFPKQFRPWIIADIMHVGKCRRYLEEHFFKGDLKLKRPFSWILAAAASPIIVLVMRATEGIPVYRKSIKVIKTFRKSIESIAGGYSIVLFPEDYRKRFSEHIDDFHVGFAHLAKKLKRELDINLKFYPVYIDKIKNTINIGTHVFSKESDLNGLPAKELVEHLKMAINIMAESTVSQQRI